MAEILPEKTLAAAEEDFRMGRGCDGRMGINGLAFIAAIREQRATIATQNAEMARQAREIEGLNAQLREAQEAADRGQANSRDASVRIAALQAANDRLRELLGTWR